MKFVALVSGGKDSIYSIMEATKLGHQLVACVHLGRPKQETEESYMYQTAGSEAIQILVEECLGVPLILHVRVGTSVNTSLVYQGDETTNEVDEDKHETAKDEVEDLYQALLKAQQQFPNIQAVSSGAILSTYQRVRIENVCSRLGLTSLSFLWRRNTQHSLLQSMIDADIHAVLVRVAAPPGLTARHLNKSLQQLQPLFHSLHDKYQFSVCGEGGEFETLVLDCPLYKKRLVLDETKVVELENDGVADLRIISCHAEAKDVVNEEPQATSVVTVSPKQSDPFAFDAAPNAPRQETLSVTALPRVCRASGGLFHISSIMAPCAAQPVTGEETESELAVKEAQSIFAILSKVLLYQGASAQDVMMVNLYLSEMSLFAAINQHYRDFFGTMLPPSRSCIGIGNGRLPGGRRVLVDCIVQCGSGQYMRAVAAGKQEYDNYYAKIAMTNTATQLRQVLHVQSISYWAPVCVGPYSQVNTFRAAVNFVAGQIGLRPETMTLRSTWSEQLEQAWTNAASVLDAVKNGSLEHIISGIVYVVDSVFGESGALDEIEEICLRQRSSNGGVCAGAIDGSTMTTMFHGYEDEGTMKECMGDGDDDYSSAIMCPLLVVTVPELPVGALAEVEVVAATQVAVSSCPMSVITGASRCKLRSVHVPMSDQWTGYDPSTADADSTESAVQIDACWVSLGRGLLGSCLVTASVESSLMDIDIDIDTEFVLGSMIDQLSRMSQSSPMLPDLTNAQHVRLYYLTKPAINDGTGTQFAFQSAVSTCFCHVDNPPCISAIPVNGLHKTNMPSNKKGLGFTIVFAIRASIVIDPIQLETELWIRSGR
jgi:diphthine-ammonia ligase